MAEGRASARTPACAAPDRHSRGRCRHSLALRLSGRASPRPAVHTDFTLAPVPAPRALRGVRCPGARWAIGALPACRIAPAATPAPFGGRDVPVTAIRAAIRRTPKTAEGGTT